MYRRDGSCFTDVPGLGRFVVERLRKGSRLWHVRLNGKILVSIIETPTAQAATTAVEAYVARQISNA